MTKTTRSRGALTKTGRAAYKLSPQEQMQVVAKIACFERDSDIHEFCEKKLGKTISSTTLNYYKTSKNWQPVLRKFRDEYTMQIGEIPLANKRRRVEALAELYERARTKSVREAISALQAIKDEVEQKMPQNVHIEQYNNLTDEQIEQRRLELLTTLKKLRRQNAADGQGSKNNGLDEITVRLEEG